jgi:hypothetical protein
MGRSLEHGHLINGGHVDWSIRSDLATSVTSLFPIDRLDATRFHPSVVTTGSSVDDDLGVCQPEVVGRLAAPIPS